MEENLIKMLILTAIVTQTLLVPVLSNDVTMVAHPTTVYTDSMTPHLSVTCDFKVQNISDLREVESIIISKSDSNIFKEVAVLTHHSNDIVDVKNPSLGAKATGHMPLKPGDAYLTLEWDNPDMSAAGEYRCDAYGFDGQGHPSVKQINIEVPATEMDVDTCKTELYRLQGITKYLITASAAYKGHRYLLFVPMERNITRSEAICMSLGGYLVEINDKEEYNFVFNFAMVNNSVPALALGATDNSDTGNWTFIHSGQPAFIYQRRDGNSPGSRCLELWNQRGYSGMVDEPCFGHNTYVTHTQGRFLCELPPLSGNTGFNRPI